MSESTPIDQRQAVHEYITALWPRLTRTNRRQTGSLIGLPAPYLIPADGSMFQEMYYWDSYFIALGVRGTEHDRLIPGIVSNMLTMFRRYGVIPNASRLYFLSRSQPPFLTQMIWLADEVLRRQDVAKADQILKSSMAVAAREHRTVWLGTAQPHHRLVYRGLSRYFDINYLDWLASCESGWDHSTRCDDRWLDHLPVDLNSMLYLRECDLARAATQLGEKRVAEGWLAAAEQRATTIRELMWDEASGFYFDFDWRHETRNPHASLAGFYPLWTGVATPEQAQCMVSDWLPRFLRPGGLLTTLEERPGRQWAAPNGWAPLHWIVATGLERYGFKDEANEVRRRWCQSCEGVFAQTGALWEKYNVEHPLGTGGVEEGLYGQVRGFGWTNGVYVDFQRSLQQS